MTKRKTESPWGETHVCIEGHVHSPHPIQDVCPKDDMLHDHPYGLHIPRDKKDKKGTWVDCPKWVKPPAPSLLTTPLTGSIAVTLSQHTSIMSKRSGTKSSVPSADLVGEGGKLSDGTSDSPSANSEKPKNEEVEGSTDDSS